MTRIDFHSNVSNQLDYACRLVRKALAAQCRMVVRHQDPAQLAEFDELLWSFSASDFLPHTAAQNDANSIDSVTPVLLSLHQPPNTPVQPFAHQQILLNLSTQVPADFTRFERLIEIVPQDTVATQSGRERYRFYQQQGYQLNHITAK
jgi:DNA polymerase-3 subunit chi